MEGGGWIILEGENNFFEHFRDNFKKIPTTVFLSRSHRLCYLSENLVIGLEKMVTM